MPWGCVIWYKNAVSEYLLLIFISFLVSFCIFYLKDFVSFNFYLFIWFLAVFSLCCCTDFFSSYNEQGLLSSCGVWASHCNGFSCCGA